DLVIWSLRLGEHRHPKQRRKGCRQPDKTPSDTRGHSPRAYMLPWRMSCVTRSFAGRLGAENPQPSMTNTHHPDQRATLNAGICGQAGCLAALIVTLL